MELQPVKEAEPIVIDLTDADELQASPQAPTGISPGHGPPPNPESDAIEDATTSSSSDAVGRGADAPMGPPSAGGEAGPVITRTEWIQCDGCQKWRKLRETLAFSLTVRATLATIVACRAGPLDPWPDLTAPAPGAPLALPAPGRRHCLVTSLASLAGLISCYLTLPYLALPTPPPTPL